MKALVRSEECLFSVSDLDNLGKMEYPQNGPVAENSYQTTPENGIQGEITMKGNDKILEQLNARLADELSAINQYMVHSEMCADWGYEELHEAIEKRAIDEMKHAEKLIGRIIFLEGRPIVSNLRPIHIGADVKAQIENDKNAETQAVQDYNADIKLAVELDDNGTREMLESILGDEEVHLDWLESQLDQIDQMGIQVYLGQQLS
jgi:bacterioferritin